MVVTAEQPHASAPATRMLIPVLSLVTFTTALNSAALAPFLPVIAAEVGTSVALLGQVSALAMLLAALLGLITGPIADNLGHRRSLVIGLTAVALGTLGIGLAPTYPLLLGAALVGAAGRVAAQPVALVLAGTRFAGHQQRQAMSWVTSGMSGAVIVGIPILTTLHGVWGWRATFVGLAALTMVVALLASLRFGKDRVAATEAANLRQVLTAYQPLLRNRPTVGLIGSNLVASIGVWAMATYLGAFFAQQHGYTTQQVGWVYLVVGSALVLGNLATSGRLGALPLRPLIVAARLATGLAIAAALILPLNALASLSFILIQALTTGVAAVAVTVLLARETPAGRATTMTLNGSVVSLGIALGSALGGLLLAVASYPVVGLASLALCSIAGWLAWWSRPSAVILPAPVTPPAIGS